ATLKRILAGTYEDPRGVCPAISDSLVGILDRCLAHAPADRFASARQLEVALSEALEELGLGDGEAVLGAFFADPGPTRAALVERLVAALLARGAEEAAEGRLPRALARVDQALALQPDAPAARALLDRLQASLRRGRLVRRTGVLAASAVGLAGLVAGGLALVRHERRPTPVAAVSRAPAPPAAGGRASPAPPRRAPPRGRRALAGGRPCPGDRRRSHARVCSTGGPGRRPTRAGDGHGHRSPGPRPRARELPGPRAALRLAPDRRRPVEPGAPVGP